MFCENQSDFVNKLTKLGYCVHLASNGEEAKAIALDLIKDGSVGLGGSMTVKSTGLPDELIKNGNPVYDHSRVPREETPEVFRKAAAADWYVCSTNAITRSGALVNIDGIGNRVTSMLIGPKNGLLIIGKNKLTENLKDAYNRVKNVAAPLNTRRLNKNTPCAATGKCADCSSPDRICTATVIIDKCPRAMQEYHLILVDEELGF